MNMFFNTHFMAYNAVNEKGLKLQKYVETFKHVLFDEKRLLQVVDEIKKYAEMLDKTCRKSKPIVLQLTKCKTGSDYSYHLAAYPQDCAHMEIFKMDFVLVERTERFQYLIDFEKEEDHAKD